MPIYAERHDGKPCYHCKRTMDMADPLLTPTRDHYPVPKSKGGARYVPACYQCNNIKGNMTADEWHAFMKEHSEWWGPIWEEIRDFHRKNARAERERRRTENGAERRKYYTSGKDKPSNPMAEALKGLASVTKIRDNQLVPKSGPCQNPATATTSSEVFSMSNNVQMTSDAVRSIRNVDTFKGDITRYVNAAVGIILVRTREPVRCAEIIHRLAVEKEARFRLWACNKGWMSYRQPSEFRDGDDSIVDTGNPQSTDPGTIDPSKALEAIFREHKDRQDRGSTGDPSEYFTMYYPHHHFEKPIIHQWLKDFGQLSRETEARLFLICPDTAKVPTEIEDDVYIMDFLVPSFAELRDCYDGFIEGLEEGVRPKFPEDEVTTIIQNGLGMTYSEFETAVALAVVTFQGPDKPDSTFLDYVDLMLKHKIEVIKKTDLLELMPPEDMASVGGFDTMKDWLQDRTLAFSEAAKEYGVEQPKGVLAVGPPGTGKSLFAKATAGVFGVPLVKFDIGKVFGKYVGESEGRIRQATKIIEAMSPCVLLVDEIDKGFGGLSGGGTDGGTSMRVLGSFLNWMQDRDVEKHPVFIVMTANNVIGLPPELMRRGRIDEIFACTFPGHAERVEIARIHLAKRGHELSDAELGKIADACDKYVGAEIEAAIKNSLIDAFKQKKKHPTADIVIKHLRDIVPLSKAFAGPMGVMHEWARNNAKPASSSMNFNDDAKPVERGPGLRKINVPGGVKSKSSKLDG